MKSLREFFEFLLREDTNNQLEQDPVQTFINQLRTLDDLQEIRSFIDETLGAPIGEGAFRTVWGMGPEKIIKVPRFPAFQSQNKNEVKNIQCLGTAFAPKLYEFDEKNYNWIVEERLQTTGVSKAVDYFSEKFNYQFSDWLEMTNFFDFAGSHRKEAHDHNSPKFVSLYNRLMASDKWFKSLFDHLRTCNIQSNDFHDNNWGRRPSTGEIVLLDLGF